MCVSFFFCFSFFSSDAVNLVYSPSRRSHKVFKLKRERDVREKLRLTQLLQLHYKNFQ